MAELETFTAAEREYFNSRGEKSIPSGGMVVTDAPEDTDTDAVEAEVEQPEIEADNAADNENEAAEQDKAETDEDAPKKRDGRVPLRKLRAEEDRRKEVERQYEELREKFSRADERLRMFYETQQRQTVEQPQKQEIAPPDPTVDPIGAIEWQRQQIEQTRQWQEQQLRVQQEQAAIQQIDNGYRQAWGHFANQQPDAMDAYQHFLKATAAVLRAQGFSKDQADAHVENEERKIAVAAFRAGVNPAEIIYREAMEMGYTPKQARQIADREDAARKADEDVARRQKAAPAAKSLSNTGGSRSGVAPSVAEIADMSEDEFAEWLAKTPESKRRKIMGD